MSDVYTGASALDFDQVAWNRTAYKSLRPELYWDRFADVRAAPFHPGSSISIPIWADQTAATTPLGEATDVDARVMDTSTVSVTLNEYGDAVIPTAFVRATAFVNVDPDVADIVGQAAGLSLDTLARTPMNAGDNARFSTASGETRPTSNAQVEADDIITGQDVRYVVAQLRGANVRMFDGNGYAGIMHPDVSYDYRSQDNDEWADPVNYTTPERAWNGEVGKHLGVRFIESPRALVTSDTGSPSTADVYFTVIFGKEALVKAFSSGGGYTGGTQPTIVVSPKADNLARFRAVGWKWMGGFGRFREDALWRIVSGSSIGDNA